jgi:hypothetical protein
VCLSECDVREDIRVADRMDAGEGQKDKSKDNQNQAE